jgi:hypothetical protein
VTGTAFRQRLLVARALGMGDPFAGVPVVRGLRRVFPGRRLVSALLVGLAAAASTGGDW